MNFLQQPWPWYVSGPLIGLMVPLLLIFGNKHFGISSTFRHICAACIPVKSSFFKYDWKKETWSLLLALGIVMGAYLAVNYMTYIPQAQWLLKGEHVGHPMLDEVMDPNNYYPGISHEALSMFMNWKVDQIYAFAPPSIFDLRAVFTLYGFLFMVAGGFLVGFGTRWANGCTSGHAIMGLSLLNPGSLVAVVGFFIGGMAVSWFVLPYLF